MGCQVSKHGVKNIKRSQNLKIEENDIIKQKKFSDFRNSQILKSMGLKNEKITEYQVQKVLEIQGVKKFESDYHIPQENSIQQQKKSQFNIRYQQQQQQQQEFEMDSNDITYEPEFNDIWIEIDQDEIIYQ